MPAWPVSLSPHSLVARAGRDLGTSTALPGPWCGEVRAAAGTQASYIKCGAEIRALLDFKPMACCKVIRSQDLPAHFISSGYVLLKLLK